MSKRRNNHYVPQWYQEGFFEDSKNTLAYLDLTPATKLLPGGRVVVGRAEFDAPTARAFCQRDLYSTFFGTDVNDEIERRLFGDIDGRGSQAVRAFCGTDVSEWHEHFATLFEYIDIQKTRTPKGLDWLRAQYPALTQNELMFEMQSIRKMHCKIWTEGVREIVSAEQSDIKFIVSDHPVTVYNCAVPPDAVASTYPNDPSIALKATQTIFPLSRDFCLILTNLEYAENRDAVPTEKRTFPRNYGHSMVRTDAFVRDRKLSAAEVVRINLVIKARARRYVAAGRKEWLYPERQTAESWKDIRETLLPPQQGLWRFGGELFASYEDGHVHYQDAFGRTEKPRDFLQKAPLAGPLKSRMNCGCGSGLTFGECCENKPAALRRSWTELSIRERNLALFRGLTNILDLDGAVDWVAVRHNLTDDAVRKSYELFEALWPLETDILQLLPKPDGTPRAVYTGLIHPSVISDFALAAPLYFGETIIEHPFLHPGSVKEEFRPTVHPDAFREEFIKSLLLFLRVIPLVELGLVNLVPDLGHFDHHLRDQVLGMARSRGASLQIRPEDDPKMVALAESDTQRSLMSLPREVTRSQMRKHSPELSDSELDELMLTLTRLREEDPLADLQDRAASTGEKEGRFTLMKLAPNFEMAMYLAQATGSCIITDSPFRWQELQSAVRSRATALDVAPLAELAHTIELSDFLFPQNIRDIATMGIEKTFDAYHPIFRTVEKYLMSLGSTAAKPNYEKGVAARFARAHNAVQRAVRKSGADARHGRLRCAIPPGGLQDRTVNRLLLMSSSERHWPQVPMAFFMGPADTDDDVSVAA